MRTSADTKEQRVAPSEYLLEAEGIVKRYGATTALHEAGLSLRSGEVVGLVGDNGSGKSTLVKILAGVSRPDAGRLRFTGEERQFANALEARGVGIEAVHQDLALCDNLSVYQNIFLGRESCRRIGPIRILSKRAMRTGSRNILHDALGVDNIPVSRRTSQLSGGQRQLVALARAEAWQARLVLLDEPTAALSAEATKRVVSVINRLKMRGTCVFLISHDLPLVLSITDRVLVLRHGCVVADKATSELTTEILLGYMTGTITSADEQGEQSS